MVGKGDPHVFLVFEEILGKQLPGDVALGRNSAGLQQSARIRGRLAERARGFEWRGPWFRWREGGRGRRHLEIERRRGVLHERHVLEDRGFLCVKRGRSEDRRG